MNTSVKCYNGTYAWMIYSFIRDTPACKKETVVDEMIRLSLAKTGINSCIYEMRKSDLINVFDDNCFIIGPKLDEVSVNKKINKYRQDYKQSLHSHENKFVKPQDKVIPIIAIKETEMNKETITQQTQQVPQELKMVLEFDEQTTVHFNLIKQELFNKMGFEPTNNQVIQHLIHICTMFGGGTGLSGINSQFFNPNRNHVWNTQSKWSSPHFNSPESDVRFNPFNPNADQIDKSNNGQTNTIQSPNKFNPSDPFK